ncbi:30S ribosomal protein S20 [soil metagenome]
MSNIKHHNKRVWTQGRERTENVRYRSTIKTLTKRLETSVAEGGADRVAEAHRELVKTIDRAASRGALHANTAARKKSQAETTVAGAAS